MKTRKYKREYYKYFVEHYGIWNKDEKEWNCCFNKKFISSCTRTLPMDFDEDDDTDYDPKYNNYPLNNIRRNTSKDNYYKRTIQKYNPSISKDDFYRQKKYNPSTSKDDFYRQQSLNENNIFTQEPLSKTPLSKEPIKPLSKEPIKPLSKQPIKPLSKEQILNGEPVLSKELLSELPSSEKQSNIKDEDALSEASDLSFNSRNSSTLILEDSDNKRNSLDSDFTVDSGDSDNSGGQTTN